METKVTSLGKVSSVEAVVKKPARSGQIDKMSEIHRFSRSELDRFKILYQGCPNSELLKVFRDLRTRIYDKAKGKNFVCMVASVVPDGGGSYVAKNLAAAIALDRTRTALVVDANFYAPTMQELIVTEAELGLTDYLDDEELGCESIVYASGIPRVRMIPVGRNTEGATERLTTPRMHTFLNELRSRYNDRFILLDAPAISEYSADARILASLCDLVLLVVPTGLVSEPQLRMAIESVGEDKIAALVYNNQSPS
ncbi:CpsD/CapB family tyrosine-protein kinase [Teredinibacter waterburyi]|uniref:CpsD/CapB family tyrosine-protein kinase n=1 Tax=Teredinibacter waterburyi TaxID=1500538 RepID=UPI001FE6886B|nr:CpsD/CapB family tyrosine-protein kinase [Teredinibacter waterburyi]